MRLDPEVRILRMLARQGSVTSSRVAAALGVSRQAAHRRLTAMATRGAVVHQGAGRGASWALPTARALSFEYTTAGLEEDRVWSALSSELPALRDLPSEARAIATYSFTEMLNNAIDHSQSATVGVSVEQRDDAVVFEIADRGIGAFASIQQGKGLSSPLEALEELSKGKVTTMPARHTGEGVFFTSKAVDRFEMTANGVRWIVDNRRDDFTVEAVAESAGTRVACTIARQPLRPIDEIFAAYTDDHEFTKTRTVVRLFAHGVEFVSRSEAKRLVRGLEAFREVILDFDRVSAVGQGFADEVFRVFTHAHPSTRLLPINMAPTVAFMVRRATGG